MHQKSFYLFSTLSILSIFLFALMFVFYSIYSPTKDIINQKNSFVKTTLLPDLAFCSDISYIRHRSITDIFSIYQDDGILREYALNSFVYKNQTTSKINSNVLNTQEER